MNKKMMAVMTVVAMAAVLCAVSPAEENPDYDYVSGNFLRADEKTLTISDYDYEKDEDVEVVVDLAGDTVVSGVSSLREVAEGDWVMVGYVEAGGRRVAKDVTVDAFEEDYEGLE